MRGDERNGEKGKVEGRGVYGGKGRKVREVRGEGGDRKPQAFERLESVFSIY